MIIAGDIGGTKTNLALFRPGSFDYLHLKTYKSTDYKDLETIVLQFMQQVQPNEPISAACFAIAGPVTGGICHATNLPWIVDRKKLSSILQIPHVYLINDLEANGWAIDLLPSQQIITLYPGERCAANRAVLSPGTGLGEAGIFWDGKKHIPFPSEGGHCEFGPRDKLQIDLCAYLFEKFGHASYERILSGPGIVNLYHFFVEARLRKPPDFLQKQLASQDAAKVITENALNHKSELCEEVLHLFLTILGAEGSNCVLKYMALGGLYLGGGIPPKIVDFMKESPAFLQGFFDKGRFKAMLEKVAVYVILDDKAALRGSANYCLIQRGEER